MECHYLLIFLALRAMIETYHKSYVANVGPCLDGHQINNVERNALRIGPAKQLSCQAFSDRA